ncbi:MAG TPA: amidohydrolase family protein [Pirellulales bacterium]|nr:amidohydrolase family protein [Pirellulales bacterium]
MDKQRASTTRRTFLKSAAAGLTTLGLARLRAAAEAAEANPGAIDAHTHFYDPTRPQGVPWPAKNDSLLYRPVLPGEFKSLTRGQHVTGTIVIEASTWLEDNQWLLDLAAKEPFIVGIVGRLDTADEQFATHLRRFAKDPVFRGIRINHDELKTALDGPAQLERIALLAKEDRQLDVNGGPEMPADVARLARAAADLRIVVNHAANLTIDGKQPPEAWLAGMRAAAAGERVFCKVSALVEGTRKTNGDAPSEVDFYRPVLDALWNVFGEDRLIYGSNWPVSERAAPYATVYQIVHSYFKEKGAKPLEKFLRTNAIRAYKV